MRIGARVRVRMRVGVRERVGVRAAEKNALMSTP